MRKHLLKLLNQFSSRNILVVGDLISDEFLYGRIARISREAPVLVLEYRDPVRLPGGAANAANNLLDLGCAVAIAGAVGRDEPGQRPDRRSPQQRSRRQNRPQNPVVWNSREDADPCRRSAFGAAADRPRGPHAQSRIAPQDSVESLDPKHSSGGRDHSERLRLRKHCVRLCLRA